MFSQVKTNKRFDLNEIELPDCGVYPANRSHSNREGAAPLSVGRFQCVVLILAFIMQENAITYSACTALMCAYAHAVYVTPVPTFLLKHIKSVWYMHIDLFFLQYRKKALYRVYRDTTDILGCTLDQETEGSCNTADDVWNICHPAEYWYKRWKIYRQVHSESIFVPCESSSMFFFIFSPRGLFFLWVHENRL